VSVTASSNNGWNKGPDGTQLHPGRKVLMQASQSAGYGQAVYYNAAGNVALNDGASPALVCAGVIVDRSVTGDSVAGVTAAMVHRGTGDGQASSTIANDAFLAADVLAVAYDAGNGVPGKLSNYSGSNRSIMGLCLGLDAKGAPIIWAGPEASLAARSLLLVSTKVLGWYAHPVDGAANTATAEKSIAREPVHATITAIKFTTLGTLAADPTDYAVINVYKADGLGGTHVLVGSYDTRAANQGAIAAGVPAVFSLSAVAGALNLLETDVLSYEVTKAASGKIVPVGVLTVIGKVI
jgi:hypothetical protein